MTATNGTDSTKRTLPVSHSEKPRSFFFGDPESQRFAIYHPPGESVSRQTGIVLCYPMGQEYIRVHRSFRHLAIRLARHGFPVLRFDYYGTGDSAGDCEDGTLEQWLTDIDAAVHELRERAFRDRIALLGIRLGASLALQYAVKANSITSLILWDPIIDGAAYLDELAEVHQQWYNDLLFKPPKSAYGPGAEVMGFPLAPALRRGIDGLKLLSISRKPADKILMLEDSRTSNGLSLQMELLHHGAACEYEHVSSQKIWLKDENMDKTLVPVQALQAITSWADKHIK